MSAGLTADSTGASTIVPSPFSPTLLAMTSEEVVYPNDAFAPTPKALGIANVKTLYGAKGDGVTDDTAAIQNAIYDYVGQFQFGIIYFPAGTYLVSKQLIYQGRNGYWGAYLTLQGENRNTSVIQLVDHAPGFSDPTHPQALIYTAANQGNNNPQSPDYNPDGSSNTAFSNHIMNLTVNTGSGNAGATGIDYMANNSARISEVSIVSGDGAGVYGISALRGWPGPYLLKDVSVRGFATGIATGGGTTYGAWMEHVALYGQSVSGIDVFQGAVSIRDLQTQGSVPAIRVTPAGFSLPSWVAALSVVDGTFLGGSPQTSAIVIPGPAAGASAPAVFVRNSKSAGYASVINYGGSAASGNEVSEWSAESPLKLFSQSSGTSLALPVAETPTYSDNNFSNWANVVAYGATPLTAGPLVTDSTTAIQAAIDSGKTTVYFPPGNYLISAPLHIRGAVQRVMMLQAFIMPHDASYPANEPAIWIDNTLASQVFIQGLNIATNWWVPTTNPWTVASFTSPYTVINTSPSTVTITDSTFMSYQNVPPPGGASGTLFLENVFSGGGRYEFYNQSVYARNLDPENWDSNAHVAVHGGSLWTLGLKIEGTLSSVLSADSGANVEVLGLTAADFAGDPAQTPMASNLESALSISAFTTNSYYEPVAPVPGFPGEWAQTTAALATAYQTTDYNVTVSETLGGTAKNLFGSTYGQPVAVSANSRNGFGSNFSLFADFGEGTGAPAVTCSLSVSAPNGAQSPAAYTIPVQTGADAASTSATWTIQSSIAGLTASWYGTANGVPDLQGAPAGIGPGTQSVAYGVSDFGPTYLRSVALRDANQNVLCVTPTVTIRLTSL